MFQLGGTAAWNRKNNSIPNLDDSASPSPTLILSHRDIRSLALDACLENYGRERISSFPLI